jgi:hypothetical protein
MDCPSCGLVNAGPEHLANVPVLCSDEPRPRLTARQRAVLACIQAALSVRGGRWVHGAPTHVFAEVLAELDRLGWELKRK